MVNAIKLAIEENGGKAGTLTITYVALDSSTREAAAWTDERVLDNARQAVRDINAIAYIGDRDSAATALSLPLTNEGGILQVSPTSSYDGLTRPGGVRTGRARALLPRRHADVRAHGAGRPRPGVGARRLHEDRGRAHARAHGRPRARGRRPRRPGRQGGGRAGHRRHRQGPHRRRRRASSRATRRTSPRPAPTRSCSPATAAPAPRGSSQAVGAAAPGHAALRPGRRSRSRASSTS